MHSFETITYEVREGIASLTFNRPDFLNAMNRQMMDEIIDALHTIREDKNVLVAVISGNGRAFMAGADIKEYARQTPEQFESFQQKGRELYALIEKSGISFIAAVNGFALGGGFEIALACDLIIAADTAKMGLPEVHLGLIPGGGGAQRLVQKIGVNRAKEMLLLGQSYRAAHMQEWGIVHAVASEEGFRDAVSVLAGKLKRRPLQSVKAIKAMLEPGALGELFETRLDKEGAAVTELFYTKIAQDLIQDFVNKNKEKGNG